MVLAAFLLQFGFETAELLPGEPTVCATCCQDTVGSSRASAVPRGCVKGIAKIRLVSCLCSHHCPLCYDHPYYIHHLLDRMLLMSRAWASELDVVAHRRPAEQLTPSDPPDASNSSCFCGLFPKRHTLASLAVTMGYTQPMMHLMIV